MNNQPTNEEHWKLLVLLQKEIAKEKGISQEEIAEKTGLKQPNVSRFFTLSFCPNLHTFLLIANAIGINFYIEDKESKTDLSILFERAMTELGRRPNKLPKN